MPNPLWSAVPIDSITYDDVLAFCQLQVPEDIDLDYKSDWPDNNDLAKTLCALSNTQGGMVLLGIEEEGKTRMPKIPPSGITGSPEVLRKRALDIAFDAIYPPVVPEIQPCLVPNTKDRYVVVLRIAPSRLMHAVDRRTRVYIRSRDNNRGYDSLAALSELRWLWEQRSESDRLREQILNMAINRSGIGVVKLPPSASLVSRNNAPRLTAAFMPLFPTRPLQIDLSQLLVTAQSLEVYHRKWKYMMLETPWSMLKWRGVSDGIAVDVLQDFGTIPYIETGGFAHLYFSMPLMPREISSLSPLFSNDPRQCLIAHVIAAYVEYIFAFAASLYHKLQFRWPLSLSLRLEGSPSLPLYYDVPGTMPMNRPFGPACLDQSLVLLELEQSPEYLKASIQDFVLKATHALFWGFGLTFGQDEIDKWIKRLIE